MPRLKTSSGALHTPVWVWDDRVTSVGFLTNDWSGGGTLEIICNGEATSLDSFKEPKMKLFNAQLDRLAQMMKNKHTETLKYPFSDYRYFFLLFFNY